MGSTFGSVHVRSDDLERVVDVVSARLDDLGFQRLDPDEPASDDERRVLVFRDPPDARWVVVADEDHFASVDAAVELATRLSGALATDAIVLTVFHSDTALVTRVRAGEAVGSFQVPEGATLDEASGHLRVDSGFLADLATSDAARTQLEAGLVADHTFPETSLDEAAAALGLGWARASCAALWRQPPAGAIKLRFTAPADDDDDDDDAEPAAWRPPGAGEHAIFVAAPEAVAACVGMPLHEHATMKVTAYEGSRVTGIGVELAGPGLALLDLPELAGWNPDLAPGKQTEIVIVPLEQRGDPESGEGRLFGVFPGLSIATSPTPMLHDTSAAGMRAWKEALHASAKNELLFHLRGQTRASGRAALAIRITDEEGRPLDANEAHIVLDVTAGPRMPILPDRGMSILPDRVTTSSDPHERRRTLTTALTYSGDGWLSGWLGFDAGFDEVRRFLLDAASELASRRAGPLDIHVTSAGTHPPIAERFLAEDRLDAHTRIPSVLADEADVKLEPPTIHSMPCVPS